jgi:protein-disulfide isomerase
MEVWIIMVSTRGITSWIAVGLFLILGAPSWAFAKKGPKISVGDDPSMKEGSPGLVLVEVSDFQCFFCAKGAREVLPVVYEKFVATGKLELIYLDLPLQGPRAFRAAEAAACAGDQDMFWDMHHQLFANQQGLSPDRLATYAEELGLDAAAFRKCLDSGRHAGGIREDMRAIINSTPAYLLGRRVPDSDKVEILDVIRGAKPYEVFEKKINDLLAPQTSGKD